MYTHYIYLLKKDVILEVPKFVNKLLLDHFGLFPHTKTLWQRRNSRRCGIPHSKKFNEI